ncbi:MAG: GNAT family N-acetyltransferase [Chitinophagales bacterium]
MLFTLETERLVLGILDESHASIALDFYHRNKDFLEPWSPKRAVSQLTLEKQAVRLHLQSMAFKNQTGVRFYLFKKTNLDRCIGNIGLSNIIRGAFQSCHLGYQIDEQEQNQGLTTEALKEIVGYAFEVLQLHRIEANIIPRNIASIRVVEKLGFEKEGFAKKYLKINGVWEDHFNFTLLNKALE